MNEEMKKKLTRLFDVLDQLDVSGYLDYQEISKLEEEKNELVQEIRTQM